MTTQKKINIATKYTARKVDNYNNILEYSKEYENLVILPISFIPAGMQSDLRHKLSNQGHFTFKIVNKIAIKVMKKTELNEILKGQLIFVGTKNLSNCMSIINTFKKIKPVCGIINNQIVNKEILFKIGSRTKEQSIGILFKTISNSIKNSIVSIFNHAINK